MRLMMFEKGNGAALGLVEGKSVIDLSTADALSLIHISEPTRH